MKTTNLIQLSVAVLCLVSAIRCDEIESRSLVDTFNEIYDTCLVHLSIDCAQPKALEWLSRSIHKREIRITDNLSIVKNDSAVVDSDASQENGSGRDNRFDLISQVDDFLSTHYLNIRYPKSVINAHVPAFMASTVDKLIPHGVQVPLEEGNVNEGRGLVKKVLVPFLLGLKFKTTVLLPLAFALIALKAWKALTLGLLSLVVSAAVVVFKLSKPKLVNYEVVHYPPHHHHLEHHGYDHGHLEHLHDHHVDHLHDHHLDLHDHHHHLDHLDVHPSAHIDAGWAPHDIAYSAHLDHHIDHHL